MVGFVVGLAYALLVAGAGSVGLSFLRLAPDDIAVQVAVIVCTFLALGWAVLPVFLFGVDETLDPSRLAPFPLRRRVLVTGLFVASFVGVPSLATLLVLIGVVIGLSGGAGSVLFGVVALAVELGLCIALSRALSCALSGLLRSRRGRDLAIMGGVLLFLGFQAANLAFQRMDELGGMRDLLGAIAGVLRWTPSGLAAHSVSDAAAGHYLRAVGELAGAVAAVAALLWWWGAALHRALVSYDASTHGGAVRRNTRFGARAASLVPAGRLGAVAVKELRYLWRDPQRKAAYAMAVGVAAVMAVSLSTSSGTRIGLTLGPASAALMLGLQAGNQFGMDGPALWINTVATGSTRDLRADISGKNLAGSIVTVPLLLVVCVVLGALVDAFPDAVQTFAVSCGVYGISLGVSTVTSVLVPYAVPERRTNVFGSPAPGQGLLSTLAAFGAMLASAALALPIVLPDVLGASGGALLLILAPAYGAGVAWLCRAVATRIGFARMPEILAQINKGSRA